MKVCLYFSNNLFTYSIALVKNIPFIFLLMLSGEYLLCFPFSLPDFNFLPCLFLFFSLLFIFLFLLCLGLLMPKYFVLSISFFLKCSGLIRLIISVISGWHLMFFKILIISWQVYVFWKLFIYEWLSIFSIILFSFTLIW